MKEESTKHCAHLMSQDSLRKGVAKTPNDYSSCQAEVLFLLAHAHTIQDDAEAENYSCVRMFYYYSYLRGQGRNFNGRQEKVKKDEGGKTRGRGANYY